MWNFKAIYILAFLASNISFAKGAECDLSQPRKFGDPSGADIASFLSGALNNPNGIICAGGFPPLNNNIATYNAHLMIFNVTREDATKPIENCNEAFSNIIEQCIQNGNYWGGVWSLNGFTYTIADIVFPENGMRSPENPGSLTTPQPLTSTVLTETDSAGNPVTLTFIASTVPKYTDLTTTTTASTTTTDSSGAAIVIPLIIGVGGVIWVPFGGVPLPPGATPPSLPPGSDGKSNQPSGTPDATTTGSPTSTSPSSSSSSSVAPVPAVTLIGDPPLPEFQQIIGIEPSGSPPDDPVDATTSFPPAATPPPSNSPPPATTPPPSNTPQTPIDPHVGMPECFPSHGANDADRVISIAMTDERISIYCAGTDPNWQQVTSYGGSEGNGAPANNNYYGPTFTLDANAPELCKLLYTDEGKSQPDVQNACTSPFKAIREACPFNGGQVKADCGAWTLQSCPLGGRCQVGEPGKHCKTNSGNTKCL